MMTFFVSVQERVECDMWQGIFIIGVLAGLAVVILYAALVAVSNADDQTENYLLKENKNE